MPFMLQSCGHALRFMAPDGICRRCSTDEPSSGSMDESKDATSGKSPSSGSRSGKSKSPTSMSQPKSENHRDPEVFLRQVGKLLAVLVNSEESEVPDACHHIAKSLASFTAAERADFIYQLIIAYCEARHEDQPKIMGLMQGLAKKHVLARTHFLQSAKRLVADTPDLVIDWPNIYICSLSLICSGLEICGKQNEDLRSLATVLYNGPKGFAEKFVESFQRICPLPDLMPSSFNGKSASARKSITKDTAFLPQKPSFFRSPEMACDRFIRPVSQQEERVPQLGSFFNGGSPKFIYFRQELLDIEERTKGMPPPENMMTFNWAGDRDKQVYGKRPRYISDSGIQHDEGSKRILESTSPHLPLVSGTAADSMNHGRPLFERAFPSPRQIILPPLPRREPELHQAKSPMKPRDNRGFDDHFSRNRPFQQDYHRGNNHGNSHHTSENIRPPLHLTLPQHSDTPRSMSGRSTGPTPDGHPVGSGDMKMPPNYRRPALIKKKFLSALSVEKDSEGESPPVLLGPSARTWIGGSGSLKPLATEQRRNTDDSWRRVVS